MMKTLFCEIPTIGELKFGVILKFYFIFYEKGINTMLCVQCSSPF